MFGRTLARSSALICDSECVRRELIERHGVAPDRVTAVPLAARALFRPVPADGAALRVVPDGLAHRRYVLSVGTIEPRKNLDAVVGAYSALTDDFRRRFPLVIVGMKGWLTSRLESLIEAGVRSREIRVLGYVDDEELARLYASARMLIYPSLYEGFGLPPLEAMASGTPVITSNVSSLPEVVGDAGIQVDPYDVDALREAIRLLSEDDGRWEALRSAGLARAAQFSWERCARETLAVYRKVLA
jgi:alpha-1,3-rhamnosyl/mannosyltransferase